MKKLLTLLLAVLLLAGCAGNKSGTFEAGKNTFLLNGKPFVVKAAEVHYPRIPREYWEHRIEMCKALGMNTLCLYVFWNLHEETPGNYDFTGNKDIAAFCKLAQKHGMYVIVRPGPYVCAEWEMGGLPWWLLKNDSVQLRTLDPFYMQHVGAFMHEVGKQLQDLQITRGGNIIMVQVENEYGSYGTDKPYVSAIRDTVRAAGFTEVPLFQCDWSSNFLNNGLDDLLWTVNFGTGADIDKQFAKLKEVRPDAPLMCSEFWSGWFDHWGRKHETRDGQIMVDGLKEMMDKGISFSLYMTHGGTTFGWWGGANNPAYSAMCSSYDYDAPISEAGWITPKYDSIRSVIQKYVKYPIPTPPAPIPVIEISSIKLERVVDALLLAQSIQPVNASTPLTFEQLNQGYGYVLYTRHFNQPISGILEIPGLRDYAVVYVDGEKIGVLNRNTRTYSMEIDIPFNATLQILVENMGRINYGSEIVYNTKGIISPVTVAGKEITGGWNMYRLPMDKCPVLTEFGDNVCRNTPLQAVQFKDRPVIYEGEFTLDQPGDTFIDMRAWGKGVIFINGKHIGRYWKVGPQQTLYIPGVWLRKGENKIVIFEQLNEVSQQNVNTVRKPVLMNLK